MNIELGNIDNIINDDSALRSLVMGIIKDIADDVVFVLPLGTSEMVKESFDNFASKINFDFSLVGRPNRILPSIIKTLPVVAAQPVIEQVLIAETLSAVDLTKRKK